MQPYAQGAHAYRFDWGRDGLESLAPHSDVVVIVDVLRFTSAVSAAIESNAVVFPYPWADDGAAAYAIEHSAILATQREDGGLSLSPTDMLSISDGARLVLPSPNGAALAFAAAAVGARHVLAGCLRNASATARRAKELADGGSIAVIAAGERWQRTSGPLRASVEDLLGAGAVLTALDPAASLSTPACSPEAAAARAAFVAMRWNLHDALAESSSGRELIDRGWRDDVVTSAALDVTDRAARLVDGAFIAD
jgi:2-phosphosulfolactate phosphatase